MRPGGAALREECDAVGEGRQGASLPDQSVSGTRRMRIDDLTAGRAQLETAPPASPFAGELALTDEVADDGIPHREPQGEAAVGAESEAKLTGGMIHADVLTRTRATTSGDDRGEQRDGEHGEESKHRREARGSGLAAWGDAARISV